MKLFNAIAIYDVYIVAETSEEARATLLENIGSNAMAAHIDGTETQFPPSESVAVEASREQAIRSAWRTQGPFVGTTISDEDYAKIKNKSTIDVFEMLYTKKGK